MTPEDLDRILMSDEALEPSSGFTARVMESVRDPLPERRFPWVRFTVGFGTASVLACAGALTANTRSLGIQIPMEVFAHEIALGVAALLVGGAFLAIPKVLFRP